MKLIELLEKIEKGDNLPAKIEFDNKKYIFDEEYNDYYCEKEYEFLSERIGGCSKLNEILNKEVKNMSYRKLKLKEHIDLFELSKDSWCGCNQDTMEFLQQHYSYDTYFSNFEERLNCYVIDDLHVNKKCFDVID